MICHKVNVLLHSHSVLNGVELKFLNTIYCGVEQLVARWAHNPKVVGSSPAPAT